MIGSKGTAERDGSAGDRASVGTPAQRQAAFFGTLARHLTAHPDLARLYSVRSTSSVVGDGWSVMLETGVPGSLTAWWRSLGIAAGSVAAAGTTARPHGAGEGRLAGFPVVVWTAITAYPGEVGDPVSREQLTAFAAGSDGAAPAVGGGEGS